MGHRHCHHQSTGREADLSWRCRRRATGATRAIPLGDRT
jgi:hypothetical protein